MRIIGTLFIFVLFLNCKEKSAEAISRNDLQQNVWIDTLCTQFFFKDSLISKRLLFQNNIDFDPIVIGKLTNDNPIEIVFDYEEDYTEKFILESNFNGKLTFKPSGENNDYLTLIKFDSIKTSGLELIKLNLKVTPNFLYSGFRDFTITSDKKITYRKDIDKDKLITTTFSDSTFKQLEKYLEILNFDKYKDKYKYYVSDGAKYELTIITNQYEKIIESAWLPTKGMANLFSFIDYKLKTE